MNGSSSFPEAHFVGWQPVDSLRPLWNRVVQCRPESDELIRAVLTRLAALDSNLARELEGPSCAGLRDAYMLRFVLPVAELARWPEHTPKILHDALAVHMLWCLYWRSLDNLLDDARRETKAVEDVTQVLSRAVRCDIELRLKYGIPAADCSDRIWEPCAVLAAERDGTLPVAEIWRRAAPFLIVPESVLFLDEPRLVAYRSYLNLFGLAHDIQDLLSDVRQDIATAPVRWMVEIDPDLQLRPDGLAAYYRRASDELSQLGDSTMGCLAGFSTKLFQPLMEPIGQLRSELEKAALSLASHA